MPRSPTVFLWAVLPPSLRQLFQTVSSSLKHVTSVSMWLCLPQKNRGHQSKFLPLPAIKFTQLHLHSSLSQPFLVAWKKRPLSYWKLDPVDSCLLRDVTPSISPSLLAASRERVDNTLRPVPRSSSRLHILSLLCHWRNFSKVYQIFPFHHLPLTPQTSVSGIPTFTTLKLHLKNQLLPDSCAIFTFHLTWLFCNLIALITQSILFPWLLGQGILFNPPAVCLSLPVPVLAHLVSCFHPPCLVSSSLVTCSYPLNLHFYFWSLFWAPAFLFNDLPQIAPGCLTGTLYSTLIKHTRCTKPVPFVPAFHFQWVVPSFAQFLKLERVTTPLSSCFASAPIHRNDWILRILFLSCILNMPAYL